MKICTKIVVLWLSTNIIKAANNISIPANKIKIHNLDNDEMWSTDDTDNIEFYYGFLYLQFVENANKHKCGDKTIDKEEFKNYVVLQVQIDSSIYTGKLKFEQEEVNGKEIILHVRKYIPVDANNIQIKINEKTFTNDKKIDNIYDCNFFESYSQKPTGNEVNFLKLFYGHDLKFNGSDLYFEMKGDNYCVKSYSCGSTNLDFSKIEPSLDERTIMLNDIKDNKQVTLTVVKCKNRINFTYIEGKEFDKINKKYQPIIDIIEKYRSGRYDNKDITFKAIVDEIKALKILPNNSEISIKEQKNKVKEYNSDSGPIDFELTWLITLPEICYKNDIKLNVKFISDDNNFELVKRIQNFENLEIEEVEGFTLLNLKNLLNGTLSLPNEFKENDGLTYNYEGNNTALKDTEVFSENKTIEIHIPNTKTNLVAKKETEDKEKDKDKDKDNNNNNIGGGDGNDNTEVKGGGKCCNYTKK